MRRVAASAACLTVGALALFALGIGSASVASADTSTPSGHSTGSSTGIPSDNFWLADAQGAVWNFGNAAALGSAAGVPLHPIVSITATGDRKGYWLLASDGGIFSYGDASFYGSTGAIVLNQPIVGMAPTPDGKGYWLVASDGGIFNFGNATFAGSAAGGPSLDPAERVVPTTSGRGYWVEDQNGTASPFGDATGAPPTEALMLTPATSGDRAVLFAFAQLGKPYIWGGNGPVGYDCSGLALAAWESTGVGFARVSDDQYHTAGQPVGLNGLSAGDLVFWGTSQTDWTTVYHTAIYVGGDQIVEATGDHVQLNSLGQWGSSDLMPNGRRP
jgi:cell wall-associated NlpC family hydrolase